MIFFTIHNYNNLMQTNFEPFITFFEVNLTVYYLSQNKISIDKGFASDNYH